MFAAFLIGCALLGPGLLSLRAGAAGIVAVGPREPIAFVTGPARSKEAPAKIEFSPTPVVIESSPDQPTSEKQAGPTVSGQILQGPFSLPRRTVCVRLCDGYYFPVGPLADRADLGDHEATCSNLCPDAATQLFIEPAGADSIEDAVSSDGASYRSLPVAFRSRTIFDKTCVCHRRPGQPFPLLNDFTLRKGDSVMTPSGIEVFLGASQRPYAPRDFAMLVDAPMPRDRRAVLAAIERASLPAATQPAETSAPARKSEIAFAAPPPAISTNPSANRSIRFVDSRSSASN